MSKLPRVFVNLWSKSEPDFSDDEPETCICFKREADAKIESTAGYAQYIPVVEHEEKVRELAEIANELRKELATVSGKLKHLELVWSESCEDH
jgi:hypothetical protein